MNYTAHWLNFITISFFRDRLNSPTYTLIACLLLCEVSQKSMRKISRYLGICKGIYLPVCVNYFPIKVFYFLDVSGKFLPLIVLTIVITVEC